ncbi:MAG: PAS domain S-box protein [Bacteroidota bacterium]
MDILEKTRKLKNENKKLQQQLLDAKESIDAIRAGKVDALVTPDKKGIKVYTETTADKTYRVLIEKMHEGAVTLNNDGTILFCNSYFAGMVNLPLQKIIGSIFIKFIDDSLKGRFENLIKRGKEKPVKEEIQIKTTTGETLPVLVSINTLLVDADFVLSIILTDLTIQNKNQEKLKFRTSQLEQKNLDLKSANKELAFQYIEKEKLAAELRVINKELAFQNEEKEKRTAEISRFFQHATEGILVVNEQGEIIKINLSAEKLFGYEKNELLGKKIEKLVPKRFSKKHVAHRNDFNRHPQARSMGIGLELSGLKKDGKEFPVEISLNPYSTSKGNFVIAYIMDITIRKKAETLVIQKTKALEQSNIAIERKNVALEKINKELEAFTFVSSHDLQEPMRKIKNFASVLLKEEEKQLSDEGKNYLRRMYRTANGMQDLIENLLRYSRVKTAERKFEKIDLSIIIDEVKKDFEELIHYKKAVIEVSNLGELNVIRFQFRQLIQNLIDNSLKFSKQGIPPHIKIKSKIAPGIKLKNEKLTPEINYCHITYTDNGIGFDPQYNERIFEILQRLHSKEKYKGAGLGLATCKRIIENHNGIITATGKLNKGARFDIYIPIT